MIFYSVSFLNAARFARGRGFGTRSFIIFVARPEYAKCSKMALSTKWRASRAIFAGHFAAFCVFWSRDENNESSSTNTG